MNRIKEELFKHCLNYVEECINTAQLAIEDARSSANDDTKSSAGDKFETGREMMQQEIDRNRKQLEEAKKMRCMFSRMMLQQANLLMFDEPTNHLDLESITALNNGMKDFKGVILFTSRDHELTETVANRIIELTPSGIIDKLMTYDEYITSDAVKQQRDELYSLA